VAPINRKKMPTNEAFDTIVISPRKVLFYFIVAATIILAVYYLPNYFFLEKLTAEHTAFFLNSFGMHVETRVVNEGVFLENVKIVRDCTGVQVVAVFLGLIIPVPNAPVKNKILTLAVVSILLYLANLVRISLEFSLLSLRLLPWSLAHYPLSVLFGIIGVFLLTLVADRLMPEFGKFIFSFRHA
jgi:exosortase/archaeosortase family protein